VLSVLRFASSSSFQSLHVVSGAGMS